MPVLLERLSHFAVLMDMFTKCQPIDVFGQEGFTSNFLNSRPDRKSRKNCVSEQSRFKGNLRCTL